MKRNLREDLVRSPIHGVYLVSPEPYLDTDKTMNAKAKFAALSMLAAAAAVLSLTACDQIGVKVKSGTVGSAGLGMELGNPDPYVKFTEAFILSLQDSAEIAPKSEPVLDPETETCTCTSAEFPEYNNLPQCFYIASAQGDTEGSGNTFISCT